MMTQEQQDIDLGYKLFNRASPYGYFHITRAGAEAFGRAVRELMGEKPVATRGIARSKDWWMDKAKLEGDAEISAGILSSSAREDVPSVEEIFHRFSASEKVRDAVSGAPSGRGSISYECARVAHDMMLQLAQGRKRMKIDGMTIAEIADSMRTRGVAHSLGAAENAHYLANTPAQDTPDPDAEAKRLADLAACVTNNHPDTKTLKQLIPDWSQMNEAGRDGWRAVAAKMGEKG